VTLTAGWLKVFSSDPRLGFLEHARRIAMDPTVPNAARLIFNDRLDAMVSLFFMGSVLVILGASVREWARVLRRGTVSSSEIPFQPRAAFVTE
jgi:carbon starvation protein